MNKRTILGVLALAFLAVSLAVLLVTSSRTGGSSGVIVPPGYTIERIVTGLTSPVAISWDHLGRMLIAEEGVVSPDGGAGTGRVLRIDDPDGLGEVPWTVILDDLSAPVRDVKTWDRDTYVAHGDTVSCFRDGAGHMVLRGLRFENLGAQEMAIDGPNQRMYLADADGTIFPMDLGGTRFGIYAEELSSPSALGLDDDVEMSDSSGLRSDDDVEMSDPSGLRSDDARRLDGLLGPGLGDALAMDELSGPGLDDAQRMDDLSGIGFDGASQLLGIGRNSDGATIVLEIDENGERRSVANLGPGLGETRFTFAPRNLDQEERMFLVAPGEATAFDNRKGGKIHALDIASGELETFAYNKKVGLAYPVDVKSGPDQCLYVVDRGNPEGTPGTGAIWKVSKERSRYAEFSTDSASALDADGAFWNPNYAPLREQLAEHLDSLDEDWGVFFKDLDSGKTFGVNQHLQVAAASTVKVPVVLYASNLASQNKLDMNERLEYLAERDWQGGAGSLQFTAEDGDTFSIRELAEKAIVESDNIAWKMLERRLGKDNIAEYMRGLGGQVVYPGGMNISTPPDLALYLEKALLFAKESPLGEKLMYDLAHTIWNTGLNRYIEDVPVAHKEGDVSGVADDVGVVYAPHPYILAIMSDGHEDVELGFEKIGELSKMIFDYQMALTNSPGQR